MPLIKSICQRCMNEEPMSYMRWNEFDEERWENGELNCFCKKMGDPLILIGEDAPRYCRYAMEHTILGQTGGLLQSLAEVSSTVKD